MTSEIIWSILGVSASTVFGAVGIYLTVKSRYSGGVTFVNEQTIELFDAIGNSLDKLAVTYDGTAVNENLILLNGAFINSGKFDITQDMVEQPITIKLPSGYKWLTGRVIDSKVKANLVQEDENTISISTGLFRCGEYVRFHALAQLPESQEEESNSMRFKKALKFQHRIVNTKSIDDTEITPKKESQKNLKRKGIPFLAMLLIMSGLIGFMIYQGFPKVMVYSYNTQDSKIENVVVKTTNNDLVKVVSKDSDFEIEEPFSEFIVKTKGNPSLSKPDADLKFYAMVALQMLFILGMLATQIFEYYRNRRILKVLGEQ